MLAESVLSPWRDSRTSGIIVAMRGTSRTSTVIFTDLVGSTRLAERLGPSGAIEVHERRFAAMRDVLAIHRGTEVKTLGDGIMAAFDSVTDGLACAVASACS